MSKKNQTKSDVLEKIKGASYNSATKLGIYCNKCGKITDKQSKTCPDCKSKDVVYVGVDKNE